MSATHTHPHVSREELVEAMTAAYLDNCRNGDKTGFVSWKAPESLDDYLHVQIDAEVNPIAAMRDALAALDRLGYDIVDRDTGAKVVIPWRVK
jgi:predicted GNAT superfamily acetyltransferase